jgi:glycosyltransferase involved in cell wall biosynthesis
VSVVVCTYTEDRWPDLTRAIESLARQTWTPLDVVVVVDHNPALLERAERTLADVHVIGNDGPQGLSGARNSGIHACRGEIIAFLDDDAVAARDWLECLIGEYETSVVMAVGGRVEPAWDEGRPPYFPPEYDWVVGCSYRGMPTDRATVRNLIGANMSFRREVFDAIGAFESGIGRIGAIPLGCEETELCIRARQRFPEREIVYQPAALVYHRVFPGRAKLRYFFSRCSAEGRSKALVAQLTGSGDALATERTYVARALPAGIGRDMRAVTRGELAGLARASLIITGAAVTAVGYARGRISAGRSSR